MIRVASLGMYDLPHLQSANDRLWTAIATRLRQAGLSDVPDRLDRDRSLDAIWDDPDLLLAQTCGYPLTTRWHGRLTYVATPVYEGDGGEDHYHRSRFVVRRDDAAGTLGALAGRRAAINDVQSNTGMNLLRRAVAPLHTDGRFFSDIVVTGSHASSLDAVVKGTADVAAIDAVTFDYLARHEPALADATRTIGWSLPVPNLPFVTSITTAPSTVDLLRQVLAESVRATDGAARTLRLHSIRDIGVSSYDLVMRLEREAVQSGYPVLA
ncbi:phosphate/phosphite/phosphonate ABC transporter substrate-binding protein [Sphingomonas sp. CFBP 8760]|uniref:phosphate/phosphite/phosphonate ABC transporter substrate-binding protein n=1 Tax=Sphingomonas sp. CFBP 8760 TaxID=2775282 RepID=UPI001783850A|nr:PhnD/SsuA/transferrin family substrate-binding protein [Sphingomonas sp. CFBP 8760]MBD8548541.1 PhnD/SsuA/transferrin family substrate-binding protein [Sphingomonas sp. CFBP 8760]